GHVLLNAQGQPDPALYLEGHETHQTVLLHPDAQGMERIAQAIAPTLDKLMTDAPDRPKSP
ncbi:MAG: hypothetical protein KGI86_05050, partial [Betaproteobacteria bacterium]|nr:hypothetical protein [Betaproteobacteria bacterium]